jgi:hypothetical protein
MNVDISKPKLSHVERYEIAAAVYAEDPRRFFSGSYGNGNYGWRQFAAIAPFAKECHEELMGNPKFADLISDWLLNCIQAGIEWEFKFNLENGMPISRREFDMVMQDKKFREAVMRRAIDGTKWDLSSSTTEARWEVAGEAFERCLAEKRAQLSQDDGQN